MKIDYARVSTKEQSFDLQLDALQKAGCEKIYREVVSGVRAERPVLQQLLENLRRGDVLVIWKLDRLGRSLKHLVELINDLREREIGLQSLNDPIDTTTAQGRLSFNLFASLAEFCNSVKHLMGPKTRLLTMKTGLKPEEAQALDSKKFYIEEEMIKVPGIRENRSLVTITPV